MEPNIAIFSALREEPLSYYQTEIFDEMVTEQWLREGKPNGYSLQGTTRASHVFSFLFSQKALEGFVVDCDVPNRSQLLPTFFLRF